MFSDNFMLFYLFILHGAMYNLLHEDTLSLIFCSFYYSFTNITRSGVGLNDINCLVYMINNSMLRLVLLNSTKCSTGSLLVSFSHLLLFFTLLFFLTWKSLSVYYNEHAFGVISWLFKGDVV